MDYQMLRDIPDSEIAKFKEALRKLLTKIPKTIEGGEPIEVTVIDRRKYEPLHYCPVPYANFEPKEYKLINKEDISRELRCNLGIAASDMDRFASHLLTEFREDREGK